MSHARIERKVYKQDMYPSRRRIEYLKRHFRKGRSMDDAKAINELFDWFYSDERTARRAKGE